MSTPDKTDPQRPSKVARSATNGQVPVSPPTVEDELVEDAPLVRREPDSRLQRHTVLWVGVINLADLVSVCVVAIATGSVPATLVAALPILATAVLVMVRHVFPR